MPAEKATAPKPFKSFKKANSFSGRGVECEKAVQKALDAWMAESPTGREANRLVDTKAAGRTIKAAAADFDFYDARGHHGLIEAKQTKHDYRLERDKVPQLPRLRKRTACGGRCVVVVYHSEAKVFRAVSATYLANYGDKGSWDLRNFPSFDSAWKALAHALPEVFL